MDRGLVLAPPRVVTPGAAAAAPAVVGWLVVGAWGCVDATVRGRERECVSW